ncbi:MAG TPA: TonB-dependent receptor [Gammaproteobacteria bacterium]
MTHDSRERPMGRGPRTGLLLSGVAAAVSALVNAPVQAQNDTVEEVVVTGSRIQRSGFTTAVPVTSLEVQTELRDIDPTNTLAEQLEKLPQFYLTPTAQEGGHAVLGAGQSHLNMRGVGVERTLVLLDGSRIVPSDRTSSVNVDYFPSALIRSVEMVTGGASAAYGADALAGVTNFILDRDFTGLKTNVQAGQTELGDGKNWQAELAFGTDVGDRFSVIGSIEARRIDAFARGRYPETWHEVPWDEDWGTVTNPDFDPNDPPGTHPRLLSKPHVHPTNSTPTGLILQPGFSYDRHTFSIDGKDTHLYQPGEYASIGGGQNNTSGGPEYEVARLGSAQGFSYNEVKQNSAFLGFDFELDDRKRLWGNFLAGKIETNDPGEAIYPNQNSIWFLTIYRDNPFLPEHINQAMHDEDVPSIRVDRVGGWGPPGGAKERHLAEHSMWSGTLGFDTDLPGSWDLRVSYQYGEADKDTLLKNWQRVDRSFLAWDAVRDPDTGEIVCNIQLQAKNNPNLEADLHAWALANTSIPRIDAGKDPSGAPSPIDYPIAVDSIDNTISDCVPLNPFGLNPASEEAWNYIRSDKPTYSTVKQHFAEIVANGTLHEGWGAGPIDQAFGLTYRKESLRQGTPAWFHSIDALGPPVNVPQLGIRGIPFGHSTGSPNLHKFSTYPTLAGGFDVWEVFTETSLPLFASKNGPLRLESNVAARYSDYSRAGGIWTWKAGLNFQVTESLRIRSTYSRDVREASFSEQFDRQAIGAFIEDPALDFATYGITTFDGGNPELQPEEADTLVFGFVYEPQWAPGLQLSADYYDIDITGAIGQLGAQRIVDECFETGVYCELIERDSSGRVSTLLNVFLNIDAARVTGTDVEIAYRMEPDFFSSATESLSFRLLGGRLGENSTTPLNGTKQDQAGSTTLPEWQVLAMLNYAAGPFTVGLQERYIDDALRNVAWVEGIDIDDNTAPSASYTNLRFGYTRDTPSGETWSVSLNVNNLFDEEPSRGPNAMNSRYDQIGRQYTLAFRYSR